MGSHDCNSCPFSGSSCTQWIFRTRDCFPICIWAVEFPAGSGHLCNMCTYLTKRLYLYLNALNHLPCSVTTILNQILQKYLEDHYSCLRFCTNPYQQWAEKAHYPLPNEPPSKSRKPETNRIPKLSRMKHSSFQRGKIWKDSTEQTQKGFM